MRQSSYHRLWLLNNNNYYNNDNYYSNNRPFETPIQNLSGDSEKKKKGKTPTPVDIAVIQP